MMTRWSTYKVAVLALMVVGLVLTSSCGDDGGTEPAISPECLTDMEAAASVPDLEENIADRNQELWPTFTSCSSVEEWEAVTIAAGVGIGVEHITIECGMNPGVDGTALCEVIAQSGG